MSIQRAEELKRDWTDKHVMVQSGVPELRRFDKLIGQVRTVNMNCRLLIEFDTPADISWYDIDPQFVVVVEHKAKSPTPAAAANRAPPENVAPTAKVSGGGSPLDKIRQAAAAGSKTATAAISPLDKIRAQSGGAASQGSEKKASGGGGGSPLDQIRAQGGGGTKATAAKVSADTVSKEVGDPRPTPVTKPADTASADDPPSPTIAPLMAVSEGKVENQAAETPFDQVQRQAAESDGRSATSPAAETPVFDQVRQQAAADGAEVSQQEPLSIGSIDSPPAKAPAMSQTAAALDPVEPVAGSAVAGKENPVNATFRGKKLPKKDDLKIVEGIGPKIAELFEADGISTWEQLSQAAPERLKAILSAAGPRYRIHNPETWPAQAKLAHNGQWQELATYQDVLDGGRPPESS